MDGLKRLLFRIIPIITLICFISLGILNTYQNLGNNNRNLTYLKIEYIDKETGNTIQYPTEEQKENSYEIYTFDTTEYVNNIDQNILQRATTRTFDMSAYPNTINQFSVIWDDGYNFGDIAKTIANVIILLIDTIILPINIVLVPVRLTAGLLLTAMSLIGININNGIIIVPFLNICIDYLNIPMINSTFGTGTAIELEENWYSLNVEITSHYYEQNINPGIIYAPGLTGIKYDYTNYEFYMTFQTKKNAERQYQHMPANARFPWSGIKTEWWLDEATNKMEFAILYLQSPNNTPIRVYDTRQTGGWLTYNGFIEDDGIIYIRSIDVQTENNLNQINKFVSNNMNLYLDQVNYCYNAHGCY